MMFTQRLIRGAAAVLITMTAVSASHVHAQALNTAPDGLAVKGYDLVAYFVDGRPTKGDARYAFRLGAATYWFQSAANRDLFAANPDRYVPQYGGFCAWAVSRNYTADTDPLAWKIVDGRLYLNYSRSVQQKWEADVAGHIKKADVNWPRLRQK